jgi:hypothetical protein
MLLPSFSKAMHYKTFNICNNYYCKEILESGEPEADGR